MGQKKNFVYLHFSVEEVVQVDAQLQKMLTNYLTNYCDWASEVFPMSHTQLMNQ